MEITILNPRLGADGNGLSALMDMLTQRLSETNEKPVLNELTARTLIRSKKENPRRLSSDGYSFVVILKTKTVG